MVSRRNDQIARTENIHELKAIVLFQRQHRNAAEHMMPGTLENLLVHLWGKYPHESVFLIVTEERNVSLTRENSDLEAEPPQNHRLRTFDKFLANRFFGTGYRKGKVRKATYLLKIYGGPGWT
jgi:hypothetical protein